jgi:hypothetical protein
VSDTSSVPSAPLLKCSTAAAVSSTSKLRVAREAPALTLSTSPHSMRRQSISWMALISTGPPPGSLRQVMSK